jgi:hypothetical protein
MDRHVGIAVAEKSVGVGKLYAANPEVAALYEAVNVVSLSYSKHIEAV